MDELNKYEVIKSLVEHNGNKQRAALKLNCTVRTVPPYEQIQDLGQGRVSPSGLASILYPENILSPRTKKATKRKMKASWQASIRLTKQTHS